MKIRTVAVDPMNLLTALVVNNIKPEGYSGPMWADGDGNVARVLAFHPEICSVSIIEQEN